MGKSLLGKITKICISLFMIMSLWTTVKPIDIIEVQAEDYGYNVVAVLKSGNNVVKTYTSDQYSISKAWSNAISTKGVSDKVFVLNEDWTSNFSWYNSERSFGKGTGFLDGRICVTSDITIDLNGYEIDRNLKIKISNGQVITVRDGATLTIIDSVGTGRITGGNNKGNGGGFYICDKNSKLILRSGSIEGNIAKNGAGVYLNNGGNRLRIYGGYITHNNASNQGGGIYIDAGVVELYDGEISYNRAQGDTTYADGGGGVYLDDSGDTFKMYGGKIIKNAAVNNGAGIYAYKGHVIATGGEISDNIAQHSGGAFYDREGGHKFENITFEGNSAGTHGSVMTLGYSGTKISNCTIINNVVNSGKGAAIYNHDPVVGGSVNVTVSNTNIQYNRNTKSSNLDSQHIAFETPSKVSKTNVDYSHNVSGTKISEEDTPAESKAVASVTPENAVTGTYRFSHAADVKDVSTEFVYQDTYFDGSGTEYNSHLATMSMNLAMSAFASFNDGAGRTDIEEIKKIEAAGNYQPGEGRDHNVYDLLRKIGFTDFTSSYPNPTIDTIGYAIAKKQIGDSTVIAIALRGANYEKEWASNVTIGSYYTGEHEGFATASEQVLAGIRNYLSNNGIDGNSSNVKFWITGYSRGGAVTNLTAKRLVDNYDSTGNRIFAYSFEPPKGGAEKAKISGNNYDGLHCIINKTDVVPYVAPTEMGFIHYGTVQYIPGETVETVGYMARRARMLEQLKNVNNDIKLQFADKFYGGTINLAKAIVPVVGLDYVQELDLDRIDTWAARFVYDLIYWEDLNELENFYESRHIHQVKFITNPEADYYSYSIQLTLQNLFNLLYCIETEDLVEMKKNLNPKKFIEPYTLLTVGDLYGHMTLRKGYRESGTNFAYLPGLYSSVRRNQTMIYSTLASYAEREGIDFRDTMYTLLDLILEFFSDDYMNNYADHLGTLANNVKTLAQGHYPEINLAWLRTYDSYYNEDGNSNSPHDTAPLLSESTNVDVANPITTISFENIDSWTAVGYEYECVSATGEFTDNPNSTKSPNYSIQNHTSAPQEYKIRVRAILKNPYTSEEVKTQYSEMTFTVPGSQVVKYVNALVKDIKGGSALKVDDGVAVAKNSIITFMADVKDDSRFTGWTVENRDDASVQDWTLSSEKTPETMLTVSDSRNLTVTANFTKKISDITVHFEPYTSPRTVEWTANGISHNGNITLLNEESGTNEEISTWKITLKESDLGDDEFADKLNFTYETNISNDKLYTDHEIIKTEIGEDGVEITVETHYHVHQYGEWTDAHDEAGNLHQRICVLDKCPDKADVEYESHSYDSDHVEVITRDGVEITVYTCIDCGHATEKLHVHNFDNAPWKEDSAEDNHYQECQTWKEGEVEIHPEHNHYNVENHKDTNADGFCDKCGAEVVALRAINITEIDSNPMGYENPRTVTEDGKTIPGKWIDSATYKFKGKGSDVYELTAPTEDDEKFVNWEIPENQKGFIALEEGYKFTDSTIKFKYVLQEESEGVKKYPNEVNITAHYIPVIDDINISTEIDGESGNNKVPSASKALPGLSELDVKITNTYTLEQLNEKGIVEYHWIDSNGNEVDGTQLAKYGEVYSLFVQINKDKLNGDFDFSEYLSVEINGQKVAVESVIDKANRTLTYAFPMTEQLQVQSIDDVDAKPSVDWGTEIVTENPDQSSTKHIIPTKTKIHTQDTSDIEGIDAEIEWDLTKFNPEKIGEQMIYGKVKLPENVLPNDAVDLNVIYTVTVKEPVLNAPSVELDSASPQVTINYPVGDSVTSKGDLYYSYTVTSKMADGSEIVEEFEATYLLTPGTPFAIDLNDGQKNTVSKTVSVTSWAVLAGVTGPSNSSSVTYETKWFDLIVHTYTPEGNEMTETTKYLVGSDVFIKVAKRKYYDFDFWTLKKDDGTDVTTELLDSDPEYKKSIIENTNLEMPAYNVHVYANYKESETEFGDLNLKIQLTTDTGSLPQTSLKIRLLDKNGNAYKLDGKEVEEEKGDEWIEVTFDDSNTAILHFEDLPEGIYTLDQSGLVGTEEYDWDVTTDPQSITVVRNTATDVTVTDKYTLMDKVKYSFTSGMNQVTTSNATDDLYFVTNGRIELFDGIKIDGKLIESSNYRTQSGSTHIWLNRSFVKTLSDGDHTIQALYRYHSEEVITKFTIQTPSNNITPSNTSDTVGPQYQSCQDVGYSAEYVWSDEANACVVPTKTVRNVIPNTSDDFNATTWVVTLVGSLLLAIYSFVSLKKYRYK